MVRESEARLRGVEEELDPKRIWGASVATSVVVGSGMGEE